MSEHYRSPEQQIVFVEGLVQQTPEIAGLQSYEYLRSNVALQKQTFIDNPNFQLNLTYPELEDQNLQGIATPMQTALEAMLPVNREMKADSLFESIASRYAELSMLSAARIMNDKSCDEQTRKEAENWFVRANEAIYGKPEPETFNGLARKYILPQLEKNGDHLPVTSEIGNELSQLIGGVGDSVYIPYVADSEAVERIKILVTERYGPLMEHIDIDKTYNVSEITEALTVALDKMGGTELGWKVRIVPNSSAIAVSAHQRQVEVGENREPLGGGELRGRVMHEIGCHAKRSMNAERAGWLSAQYGNEGYLDFEEALATAFEDAYKGVFRESGTNYYLIAGLAYGLDNHAPRDLRDTFEIMWRYNALKAQKGTDDLTEEQLQKAKSSAFTSCMRLFRGTTTTQPGIVYLKDLSYFNGQKAAWSVLEQVQSQEDFDLLEAGKLDLTRADHMSIARQIVAAHKVQ